MVPHRMLFGNMLREIILFGIYLVGVCGDESWCKATPQAGLPAYGRCLPVDQAMARYVVQVAPLAAFGLEVKYVELVFIGGGVHPRARISLIGSSRSSGPKVLEGSFPPGSNRAIRLQAADVGELQAIVLSNDSAAAPWFCKHITVRSEGKAATFKVGKWVGVPYPSSVYVPRYPTGLELTPQDIDCHTRAADVFEGHPGAAAAAARVHCPTNCQASEFAHTQGASLHPALSSICTAAILDGLLTPSGGDLVLTAVGPVDQYTGTAYNGIDSVDFAYSVDRKQYSFHMYLVGE
ncbi:hypothetical protein ETH_00019815 [Eimeria tenella]|uniref:Uncharacterized protein n=1 Tax=Eimeria tenella TaxID=5802 RepID=U6KRD3_EIMTE|nr:hypothetical protein ETH_00019815 [Eimeria tenella]CDJ40526.1 hypothetical protein ETH_00019815 [Eimeria tenella]|eukprot:XP_013231276.1 hypothetical protein ETH_00019815 [Eimeria tenella]